MKLAKVTLSVSFLLLTFFVASCGKQNTEVKKSFDVSGMDKTVKPQDDFYHYAVGNWLKNNPIPDDQVMWASFSVLAEKTRENVKSVVLKATEVKNAKSGSIEQKVGTFYLVGMDTAKIEKEGITPIKSELERISKISNLKEFIAETAHQYQFTSSPLFDIYAGQDSKNSKMMIAQLSQGGLGLPDRDYYIEKNERAKSIRAEYKKHLKNMFLLLGDDAQTAETEANAVFNLEKELAKVSNTRTENRNPVATYNKMTTAKLRKLAKGFDWDIYFKSLEIDDPKEINVEQPKFFKNLPTILKKQSINNLKSYLRWNLIRGMASTLNKAFVDERFNFTGKFLTGQKIQQPRWKKVLGKTNEALGELVGQLYVKEFFPHEAKERAVKIVDNLLKAMGERIKNLDWMTEKTKEKALTKLAGFGVKIGYPDKWQDYSKLDIKDDSYAANSMRSNYFHFRKNIEKINKPVDKTKWWMTPQTVNAGYNPLMNDITFPAAILQFPFFDKDVDDAINYGAMGAVIGHEITHGFDDQGRQFDVDGNLNNWWTESDLEKFTAKTGLLAEQFDNYSPFEGFHVNGKMTLGENIADLGGLTVAYQAFSKTEQFKKNEKIDGFTPAQRFFLSWAQVWKTNIRDEALKTMLKVDVHSPAQYRVIGPLSNLPQFFKAFNVKPGDKMRRADDKLVKIW